MPKRKKKDGDDDNSADTPSKKMTMEAPINDFASLQQSNSKTPFSQPEETTTSSSKTSTSLSSNSPQTITLPGIENLMKKIDATTVRQQQHQ